MEGQRCVCMLCVPVCGGLNVCLLVSSSPDEVPIMTLERTGSEWGELMHTLKLITSAGVQCTCIISIHMCNNLFESVLSMFIYGSRV